VLVLANVLLVASGALLLLLAFSPTRSNPEGPVGAHLVTLPLALGQAGAVAFAVWGGAVVNLGVPSAWLYTVLPGQLVALTALPILALEPRRGARSRLAVVLAVLGTTLLVDGHSFAPSTPVPQRIGAVLVLGVAAIGYGMILALLVQERRNAIRSARASVARQSDFEARQAEWQLGEWQNVPADAPLWRLVQFTHAFHPDVKRECLARIEALPELDAAMTDTLTTGWAEQALAYIRDDYPRSRAALAPALETFFDAECKRWRKTLDGTPNPGSYFGNLMKFVEVAMKVQADGGDMRTAMGRWAELLQGRRGLEPLANQARTLARAK
jgi:hypothetical protein